MAGKTEVLGIAELRQKFVRLKDVDRGARSAVSAAGTVVKKRAKQNAAALGLRRTGALIANIAIKRERTPEGIAQYNLGVRHGQGLTRKQKKAAGKRLVVGASGRIVTRYDNDPYYWRFHEFGTAKMRARPFIGPALDQSKGEAIEAMGKAIDRAIKRQAGA